MAEFFLLSINAHQQFCPRIDINKINLKPKSRSHCKGDGIEVDDY